MGRLEAERAREQAAAARKVVVRRHRREDDQVEVIRRRAGVRQRVASRLQSRAPRRTDPRRAKRRSWMPVRWRIHSSLVSIRSERRSLVTTPSGTCTPVPRTTVVAAGAWPLGFYRHRGGDPSPTRRLPTGRCRSVQRGSGEVRSPRRQAVDVERSRRRRSSPRARRPECGRRPGSSRPSTRTPSPGAPAW